MTENKRFKNVEEKLEWGTVQYFTYHDEKITDKELEKLVNHLLNQNDELNEENKQLKSEIEKLSYANEDLLSEKRNWQRMSDEYCKLSEENEQLYELIDSANTLIAFKTSESCQKAWEKRLKELEND